MENKLAETASKRPLALTVGAAAVTLFVILAVLAGPSVVTCFNSPDGMGQCLRGRMVDVGLIPANPATVVADAEATEDAEVAADAGAPADAAPAQAEVAVTPEPEMDVAPAQEPAREAEADAEDVVAATFGLLRAEPDGSVVIAGSGTPGTEVEVFANGEPLGVATVEDSGDWVLVPEEPLPPGGLEITLGETGKPGTAAESFIVVIDEDRSTQPLVVASTPGQASEVLQGLTETPAASVAEAEPAVQDTAEPAAVDEPVAAAAADAPEATVTTAEEPQVAATEEQAAPATAPPDEAPEPDIAVEALPEAPATATVAEEADTDQAAGDATPAVQPETGEPPAPAVAATEQPAAEANEPAVAALETPPEETTEPPAVAAIDALPPTIDAIEKEGDRTFFAGAGPEGGTVRLYVDDQFVADAEVTDGRWLVEAGDVLDEPNQRVRADLLREGTAEVASRAEVDFVVELPEPEEPIAVAEAETGTAAPQPAPQSAVENPVAEAPPAPAAEAIAPAAAPALRATAPAAQDLPAPAEQMPALGPQASGDESPAVASAEATPNTEPEAISETASSRETPAAPTSASATEPTSAIEPEPAAEPSPAAEPNAATEPSAAAEPEPVVEPAPTISPAAEPAVAEAEPESHAEPEVPTMVAVSLGDPEAQRFASGKAIIRRGDNLWTIARRVYGEGIKYTTIYDANTGQIRDPDRIYPGQVFDLPEGLQ